VKNELLLSLLEEVKTLVRHTGIWVHSRQSSVQAHHIDTKFLNNLVTDIDRESERRLTDTLLVLLPGCGIMGEEGINNKQGHYTWIIDPLDGTTNFIHGIPQVAISVALAHGDELLLGVVYEIFQDELFYAAHNAGAFKNGRQIRVSDRTHLSTTLLSTGLPFYDFSHLRQYTRALHHFMRHTRGLRRCGSAATDLCYVACGRYDGFFEQTLQPWDMAAGICIIREAGGLCTDFNGENNTLSLKEIIAANPAIHHLMHTIISSCYNDESPLETP